MECGSTSSRAGSRGKAARLSVSKCEDKRPRRYGVDPRGPGGLSEFGTTRCVGTDSLALSQKAV